MKTLGVIIACGKEEEIEGGNQVAFLPLGNAPVFMHSLKVFEASASIDGIILAITKERVEPTLNAVRRFGCKKVKGVVVGGVNRLSTLRMVYSKMPEKAGTIVIHEASRPFVKPEVLAEVIKSAKRYGCAVAANRIPDAVKFASKGMKVEESPGRNTIWAAQTPQAFKEDVLRKLVESKIPSGKIIDDESEFVFDHAEIHLVESGECNMKIRTKKDLAIAEALHHANLI